MKSEYLSKSNLGILLSNEVISSVFDKKQQLIINASMYKSIINRPIYVINDDKCYGVIELSTPSKITIDEFDSLEDKHNISKEQKNKWWPNKQILFSYKIINVVSKFDKPKLIKQGYKTSYNFVVNSFEFKEGSLFSKNELSECYRLLESIKKEDAQIIKIPKCEAELNYSFVTFENIYEAVEHMFVNGSSFIVEQEYSGVDCTLIKSNDNCYLYSYKKRDISSLFPQIIEQGKIMSGRDYALDCRISIKSKSNEEVKQLIDTDTIYNESDVQLHVIDCLVYDADVRDLEYRDRKQILQGMSYSKNIYETPFLYVEDCNETVHGYNIMNMSDNNVIIKSNNKTNAYIINQELSESSIGNHSFFATQSGPMMYYVGFLSCDGYVDNKTNRIEIHISKEDGEIIRNFQKLIKDNRKITNGFLKFKSVEMVKDLAKYGMDVLKPKRRTFDKIPSQYKWDFIRGCMDADGTMSKEKIQFDSGNREMVKWMYNQLKKVGGEHVKYYEYESTSKCTVYKKAIKRVHSKIYSGSGPSLQRKKNYLQDKSQIDDKDSKILEGETTTSSTGIASIQGKTFIKKNPIKTQAIMQGSEDVIDSRKKDSLLVYLLKKNNKFFVKTEKDGVILEFYVFDNEEDALQMFNKIKED